MSVLSQFLPRIVDVDQDNTTTANTFYPALVFDQTSGQLSGVRVANNKLYFNPSTGTLNATNFNSLSDQTLKYNIKPITHAVGTIRRLQGKSFQWKDNNTAAYGVIAQEIEKVLPELVAGENPKTVNYAGLIGFLIEAIKELDSQQQSLILEVNNLSSKLREISPDK